MFRTEGHPEATAQLAAWWRLVEMCHPSHAQGGAATFCPTGASTLEDEWEAWVEQIYAPLLGPSFAALYQAASGASPLNALAAVERALNTTLSEAPRQRSLALGRKSLLDFVPPQGAKLLERLRQAAETDKTLGHFVTVFAVRAHVFHLPVVEISAALLLAECLLGAESLGVTLSTTRAATLIRRAREAASGAASWNVVAV